MATILLGGKSNQQVSSTYVDDVAQSVAQRIRRIERSIPPTVSSLDSLESIMTVSREFLKEKSVFELYDISREEKTLQKTKMGYQSMDNVLSTMECDMSLYSKELLPYVEYLVKLSTDAPSIPLVKHFRRFLEFHNDIDAPKFLPVDIGVLLCLLNTLSQLQCGTHFVGELQSISTRNTSPNVSLSSDHDTDPDTDKGANMQSIEQLTHYQMNLISLLNFLGVFLYPKMSQIRGSLLDVEKQEVARWIRERSKSMTASAHFPFLAIQGTINAENPGFSARDVNSIAESVLEAKSKPKQTDVSVKDVLATNFDGHSQDSVVQLEAIVKALYQTNPSAETLFHEYQHTVEEILSMVQRQVVCDFVAGIELEVLEQMGLDSSGSILSPSTLAAVESGLFATKVRAIVDKRLEMLDQGVPIMSAHLLSASISTVLFRDLQFHCTEPLSMDLSLGTLFQTRSADSMGLALLWKIMALRTGINAQIVPSNSEEPIGLDISFAIDEDFLPRHTAPAFLQYQQQIFASRSTIPSQVIFPLLRSQRERQSGDSTTRTTKVTLPSLARRSFAEIVADEVNPDFHEGVVHEKSHEQTNTKNKYEAKSETKYETKNRSPCPPDLDSVLPPVSSTIPFVPFVHGASPDLSNPLPDMEQIDIPHQEQEQEHRRALSVDGYEYDVDIIPSKPLDGFTEALIRDSSVVGVPLHIALDRARTKVAEALFPSEEFHRVQDGHVDHDGGNDTRTGCGVPAEDAKPPQSAPELDPLRARVLNTDRNKIQHNRIDGKNPLPLNQFEDVSPGSIPTNPSDVAERRSGSGPVFLPSSTSISNSIVGKKAKILDSDRNRVHGNFILDPENPLPEQASANDKDVQPSLFISSDALLGETVFDRKATPLEDILKNPWSHHNKEEGTTRIEQAPQTEELEMECSATPEMCSVRGCKELHSVRKTSCSIDTDSEENFQALVKILDQGYSVQCSKLSSNTNPSIGTHSTSTSTPMSMSTSIPVFSSNSLAGKETQAPPLILHFDQLTQRSGSQNATETTEPSTLGMIYESAETLTRSADTVKNQKLKDKQHGTHGETRLLPSDIYTTMKKERQTGGIIDGRCHIALPSPRNRQSPHSITHDTHQTFERFDDLEMVTYLLQHTLSSLNSQGPGNDATQQQKPPQKPQQYEDDILLKQKIEFLLNLCTQPR